MENERIQFLETSLAANPDDTFVRYALALELARAGNSSEAWKHFQVLLERHPDYVAAYYQAGLLLTNQNRTEEARQVLTRGIEVAGRLGDAHTAGELQAALDDLD